MMTHDEIITPIIAAQYPKSIDDFYIEKGIQKSISFRLEVLLKNYACQFCPSKEIFEARWTLFTLSNGGFYYKPQVEDENKKYRFFVNTNYFDGELTAEELGIVVSLFAINRLCNTLFIDYWTELYYLLRDYAIDHHSGSTILRAID